MPARIRNNSSVNDSDIVMRYQYVGAASDTSISEEEG